MRKYSKIYSRSKQFVLVKNGHISFFSIKHHVAKEVGTVEVGGRYVNREE